MKHLDVHIHQAAETLDQTELSEASAMALQKIQAMGPAETINGNMQLRHGSCVITLNITTAEDDTLST